MYVSSIICNALTCFDLWYAAAFLGFGEEYYQASEDDGALHVCVTLFNHTERNVTASVYALPGSASGTKSANKWIF